MSAPALLLAISRDDAKRLFAQKDEASLRAFLRAQVEQAAGVLHLDQGWETLHRALAEQEAGTPLADALLGGRPMHRSEDWQAFLKRPDAVPHIAAALTNLARGELAVRLQGGAGTPEPASLLRLFEAVHGFYEAAAANQQAAILVVQP